MLESSICNRVKKEGGNSVRGRDWCIIQFLGFTCSHGIHIQDCVKSTISGLSAFFCAAELRAVFRLAFQLIAKAIPWLLRDQIRCWIIPLFLAPLLNSKFSLLYNYWLTALNAPFPLPWLLLISRVMVLIFLTKSRADQQKRADAAGKTQRRWLL